MWGILPGRKEDEGMKNEERGMLNGEQGMRHGERSATESAVQNGQGRGLTAVEFNKLADVPPEVEWFANIRNRNTRVAYEQDLREF
jgi:hypothetical protein